MSGRAGRRGKDDRGIVIQMVNSAVPPEEAKKILYGGERAVEIATDIIINGTSTISIELTNSIQFRSCSYSCSCS